MELAKLLMPNSLAAVDAQLGMLNRGSDVHKNAIIVNHQETFQKHFVADHPIPNMMMWPEESRS